VFTLEEAGCNVQSIQEKTPKVNIDASHGSMSYLDFLAMWCGIPSLCMQEGMSLF